MASSCDPGSSRALLTTGRTWLHECLHDVCAPEEVTVKEDEWLARLYLSRGWLAEPDALLLSTLEKCPAVEVMDRSSHRNIELQQAMPEVTPRSYERPSCSDEDQTTQSSQDSDPVPSERDSLSAGFTPDYRNHNAASIAPRGPHLGYGNSEAAESAERHIVEGQSRNQIRINPLPLQVDRPSPSQSISTSSGATSRAVVMEERGRQGGWTRGEVRTVPRPTGGGNGPSKHYYHPHAYDTYSGFTLVNQPDAPEIQYRRAPIPSRLRYNTFDYGPPSRPWDRSGTQHQYQSPEQPPLLFANRAPHVLYPQNSEITHWADPNHPVVGYGVNPVPTPHPFPNYVAAPDLPHGFDPRLGSFPQGPQPVPVLYTPPHAPLQQTNPLPTIPAIPFKKPNVLADTSPLQAITGLYEKILRLSNENKDLTSQLDENRFPTHVDRQGVFSTPAPDLRPLRNSGDAKIRNLDNNPTEFYHGVGQEFCRQVATKTPRALERFRDHGTNTPSIPYLTGNRSLEDDDEASGSECSSGDDLDYPRDVEFHLFRQFKGGVLVGTDGGVTRPILHMTGGSKITFERPPGSGTYVAGVGSARDKIGRKVQVMDYLYESSSSETETSASTSSSDTESMTTISMAGSFPGRRFATPQPPKGVSRRPNPLLLAKHRIVLPEHRALAKVQTHRRRRGKFLTSLNRNHLRKRALYLAAIDRVSKLKALLKDQRPRGVTVAPYRGSDTETQKQNPQHLTTAFQQGDGQAAETTPEYQDLLAWAKRDVEVAQAEAKEAQVQEEVMFAKHQEDLLPGAIPEVSLLRMEDMSSHLTQLADAKTLLLKAKEAIGRLEPAIANYETQLAQVSSQRGKRDVLEKEGLGFAQIDAMVPTYLRRNTDPASTANMRSVSHERVAEASSNQRNVKRLSILGKAWAEIQNIFRWEPQVPEGMTRSRWKCKSCAQSLWDDFVEIQPGTVGRLQTSLEQNTDAASRVGVLPVNSRGAPNMTRTGVQVPSSVRRWLRWLRWSSVKPSEQDSVLQSLNNIPLARPGNESETLHLLLCLRSGKHSTKLVQLHISDLKSDYELFRVLRNEYRTMRGGILSSLSLRTLRKIKFVQFEMYRKNKSVDIIKVDDVPPADHTDYRYAPKPTETLPPVGENIMMHFFENPEHAEEGPVCLDRFPKKLRGNLVVSSGLTTNGWGLQLVEGWNIKAVWILCVVFLAGGGVLFGVLWTVHQHSMQDAFSAAAVFLALVGIIVGFVQAMIDG